MMIIIIFTTIATNLTILCKSPHHTARINVSRNGFLFLNANALVFPNGFFHSCTTANANVYVLPQNDRN